MLSFIDIIFIGLINISITCLSAYIVVTKIIKSSDKKGDNEAFLKRLDVSERNLREEISSQREKIFQASLQQTQAMQNNFNSFSSSLTKAQLQSLEAVQNSLRTNINSLEDKMTVSLDKVSKSTEERLITIGSQVDSKLNQNFEKSNATFTDIIKRLALIDNAQQKITELSNNVVSLQEILSDKRSRGAFGEIQLNSLIKNMLPPNSYSFQYSFSTGVRADCVLFLPEPTGTIAIDAKFPLESYNKLTDVSLSDDIREKSRSQFRLDLKKHIKDIQEKYIIANETTDGAILFLPAEAVFAEIHAHFPEIISQSQQAKVWITSPTTIMAILTTARAVIKDDATKKQIHIIQEHLRLLATDFERFDKRMDNLAKHINQANQDVSQVQTSAKKISQRFEKIDAVEIDIKELTEKT